MAILFAVPRCLVCLVECQPTVLKLLTDQLKKSALLQDHVIYEMASCEVCSVNGKQPNVTVHNISVLCGQAGIRRWVLVTALSVASKHTPLRQVNLITSHPK